jgi:hypothetical protein
MFVKKREFRPPKTDTTPKACPLLTHGVKTNFPQWKEIMRGEIAMEYGILVSIIDSGEILYPAEVDSEDYNAEKTQGYYVLCLWRARAHVICLSKS